MQLLSIIMIEGFWLSIIMVIKFEVLVRPSFKY